MNATEHFYLLLKPLFPENADLKKIDLKTDDLIFRVQWRVPTAERPNRYSRPIQVRISLDHLEDFASDRKGQFLRDKYIAAKVKQLLGVFVDDHIAAPAIDWFITPGNTYGAAPPEPAVT
jgi:hypothetical protein